LNVVDFSLRAANGHTRPARIALLSPLSFRLTTAARWSVRLGSNHNASLVSDVVERHDSHVFRNVIRMRNRRDDGDAVELEILHGDGDRLGHARRVGSLDLNTISLAFVEKKKIHRATDQTGRQAKRCRNARCIQRLTVQDRSSSRSSSREACAPRLSCRTSGAPPAPRRETNSASGIPRRRVQTSAACTQTTIKNVSLPFFFHGSHERPEADLHLVVGRCLRFR